MTQPHPFQPVLDGAAKVRQALAGLAARENLPSGFVGGVEAEMQTIVSEASVVPPRPLHPGVEVPLVERLAGALDELALYLSAARRGGAGTDVGLEQEHALMERVRNAHRTFQSITRAH